MQVQFDIWKKDVEREFIRCLFSWQAELLTPFWLIKTIYISFLDLSTHHVYDLRIDGFCDDVPVMSDVLHHLAESRPLHLLPFQVAQGVGHEVKEHTTLTQFLHK